MDSSRNILGERAKFFREKKHLTQETLSDLSGLSQTEISRIENGHFRNLSAETIRKLARVFEIAPDVLVQGTPLGSLFGLSEILPDGPLYEGPPFIVYFASALTGLTPKQYGEVAKLDEEVHDICRTYKSHSLALYRPRLETSPQLNPAIAARSVYDIDQEHVSTADLLVLAAIFPSLGAGMELEIAYQSCSSVILLTKKEQPISKMALGCPARKELVEFEDSTSLRSGVAEALDKLLPNLAQLRFSSSLGTNVALDFELGQRVRDLRERRGFSIERLASMVGVDAASISSIETKAEQVTNPSLKILRHIARALDTSETYVITGHDVPINLWNPVFADHMRCLIAFADENGMSSKHRDVLWHSHVEKYQYEFSLLGSDRRADVGNKRYWGERYETLKHESTTKSLFKK